MSGLEATLMKIENLKRDLSAEIGIQEEERESTKIQLQQIYENSEWYSARYSAGISLGVDSATLSNQLEIWGDDLRWKLKKYKEGEGTTQWWFVNESDYNFGGPEDNYWVEGPEIVEDIETRINAASDLGELFKLTKSAFVKAVLKQYGYGSIIGDNPQPEEVSEISGRSLGYSSARIFLHQPENLMRILMPLPFLITPVMWGIMIFSSPFPSSNTLQKTNEQAYLSNNLCLSSNTENCIDYP
jgi:hypothetical protein